MGKNDLSRGRHWHGRGEVQRAGAGPDHPLDNHLPLGHPFLPSPQCPPPRKGQQSFLPSPEKHIYLGQAHPRWPHNGPYQLWSQARRPSAHRVSHISCFHPAGQGWAQSGHILTGAKRRQNTPPSLPGLSINAGLAPPRPGGAPQQEAGIRVCEDLRGKGRGGHLDKHAAQAEGVCVGGCPLRSRPGYMNQNETGMLCFGCFPTVLSQ